MQYLDELLALYPEANRSNKKFILSSLLDAAPDRCGDETARLLWQETAEQDPIVRRQARYVLGRFLPRHTALNYGLPDPADRTSPTSATRVEADDRLIEAEQTTLVQVAGYMLRKVLKEAWELAHSGSPRVRDAACLLMGKLWTHRTVKALGDRTLVEGRISFGPAFALAEIGHKGARTALYEAAWAAGPTDPDIYMLLGSSPTKQSVSILEKHEEKATTYGRTNIAHALSSFPPAMARPLVERILSRDEDWPTAFVLDSIASWGDSSFFELAKQFFEKESSPFLRAQAARAIGTFRSPAAVEFCRARLKDKDPVVQAAAVDGLIRNATDLGALRDDILPLVESSAPRVRVRTMLLLAQSDPARLQEMLTEMVGSESTKDRRAAVHVLGFFGGQGVEDLLGSIAVDDPAPNVRTQAIRSLAGLQTPPAVEQLVATMARTTELDDIKDAMRALSCLDRALVGDALDGVLALPPLATGAAGRALLLRTIGVLAAVAYRPPPEVLLAALDDPEPTVVAGALEGVRRLGDNVPIDTLKKLAKHQDSKVRTRAAGALLTAGEFSAATDFIEMLSKGRESVKMSALNMLVDVACLIPLAVASDRFQGLCGLLRRQREAPEFATYQEGAPGTVSQVEIRPVAKPAAVERAVEYSLRSHHTGRQVIPDLDTLRLAYRAKVKAKQKQAGGTADWKIAARAMFRWPQVLVFVPFLVIGFFMYRAFDAPPPGETPTIQGAASLARGTFGTVELEGVCTAVGTGGKPRVLRPGMVVTAGDQLETDGKASVTLADALGNSIKLAPSSKVAFAEATPMTWSPVEVRYAFAEVAGDVTFDFRKVSETKVRLGASVLTLGRGAARITDDPPAKRVQQMMGEGALIEVTGRLARLTPGKSALVVTEAPPPQ
jgi:HEAT repeat protein